jgi:hypothetical protein
MAHAQHAKTLPADLNAPAAVQGWRSGALIAGLLFTALAALIAVVNNAQSDAYTLDHLLRSWLLGFMLTFGLAVGGLALLMVQYVTGGKWGFLLRRILEAMSRTLPLVFAFYVVIAFNLKRLYLWALVSDVSDALRGGIISETEAHAINFKHPMLNAETSIIASVVLFLIWGFYVWHLNRLGLKRDADKEGNNDYWQKKLENISGPGIIIYALTMSAGAIYWVMSLDVTWYSSVYGLLFLVGQGYSVLAFSIAVAIRLSKYEPFKTILRTTEQHDLGKFTFAFVMLNIYLAFSQFLIIWSGNSPEEIPWYLARFNGGWGYIITLDFIFHWLIPFSLLLSRDLKRNKNRLFAVCLWMLFARAFDLFWLIEPNFKDAAGNLHFTWGILEYVAVPCAMVSFWLAYFFTQLMSRPVVATNDPHLAEILEPEHAA